MLDDRDRRILALLQMDADMPVNDIADKVALSLSACSRRILRLTTEGYIAKRVAILDRRKINLPMTIFVIIKTAHHAADWLNNFRAAIADIPEIVEVHRLAGNFDYIMKLAVRDVEHYDIIYKRLVQRSQLFDVSAYISMETMKMETTVPTTYA